MNVRFTCNLFIFLAMLCVFALSAVASEEDKDEILGKRSTDSKKKKGSSFSNAGDDEIRMLRRLLELPPARLKMLRKTIERLENYSEEERETMKKKLAHFRNRSPEERKVVIDRVLKRHSLLKAHLDKLSPAERASRMKRFQSSTPIEKRKFLDGLQKATENQTKP